VPDHHVLFAITLIRRVYFDFRRLAALCARVTTGVAFFHGIGISCGPENVGDKNTFNGRSGPSQNTVSP
jgi:hypothetical protein